MGNARLMAEEGIDISTISAAQNDLAATGRTAIAFAVDGKAAGVIALADAPRETAAASIAALHESGIRVATRHGDRSVERRGGQGYGRQGRSGWVASHTKKNT